MTNHSKLLSEINEKLERELEILKYKNSVVSLSDDELINSILRNEKGIDKLHKKLSKISGGHYNHRGGWASMQERQKSILLEIEGMTGYLTRLKKEFELRI